jgi:S-adenosylmethionine uptake transporter
MTKSSGDAVIAGSALVLAYTAISAGGDAAAKYIAGDYASPQLFVLSGGVVTIAASAACCRKGQMHKLKTDKPIAMLIRSVMTTVSASLFFYAMRVLSLAEIFLFVGLMPVMAALLTPFVLKEAADTRTWIALIAGFIGVLFLFPEGVSSVKTAHLIAFGASFSGVISMVTARYIGRGKDASMALLFYPHLLTFVVMLAVLPFVYRPMPLFDLGIAALYSGLLFVGRYVLVRALAMAPAHVVLPVMNVQFIWMVILGAGIFAESPTMNVYLGAAIVIMSCVALVVISANNSARPVFDQNKAASVRGGRLKWPRSKNWSHSRTSLSHSDYQSQNAHRSAPR